MCESKGEHGAMSQKTPGNPMGTSPAARREPWVLMGIGTALLILSAIGPHDRLTWVLEVAPILIGVPILIMTGRCFPLTPLAYRLVFIHAAILMVGAHYTYALVPLGEWAKEIFHVTRNHYDRLGHLAQGFVPAILAREILLRRTPLVRGKWLFFLVCCVCMAISVVYEFTEWWAAVLGGDAADSFLGSQGDVWDTQWDMFMCTMGAILAQMTLARVHDRELGEIVRREG
jgi:putative membrane protein